jgi:hypothetical protein
MPVICWGNLAKSADDTQRIEQAIQEYVDSHNENPNAHMGSDYSLGSHRLQTLLDHPYNSIRYWHVYDVHADSITAGALVVKGGGPYIVVQDQSGAERVKIYPEGIIVKNGRITVQNEGNVQIIDGKGLFGQNVFINGIRYSGSLGDIGNNWKDVPNLYHGVYVPRSVPVMLFGTQRGSCNVALKSSFWRAYVDAGSIIRPNPSSSLGWSIFHEVADEDYSSGFIDLILLPPGSHTIKLQARSQGPSETLTTSEDSAFGYMVLGS